MRVLLDTHTLLWAVAAPELLSDAARGLITDRHNEVLVSAASAWEFAAKHRLGKLPDGDRLIDDWDGVLARFAAQELAISSRHTLYAGSLRWDHRDPFDRMLAAQSILESLPLITRDRAFSELPGLRVRW